MINWAAARSFVALKFRTMTRTPQAMIGLILGLILGCVFGALATFALWTLRGHEHAELTLALALSGLAALWFLGPLVLGGGEIILDVRRFGPLPLSRSTIAAGLLLASFIGVPTLVTVVIVGASLTHASSAPTGAVMVAAAVVFVVSVVMASRVAVAFMTLLFGTRFRAAATAITMLVAISLGAASQSLVYIGERVSIEDLRTARNIVRWLPTSWAAEALALASSGRLLVACGFLVAATAFVAVVGRVWSRLLARHIEGEGAEDPTRRHGPLVPSWMDRLVDRRTAAAWARANRSIRRDPREWAETAAFIPLVLAFSLPAVTVIRSASPNLMLVSYLAVSSSVAITTSNIFGSDGPTFVADAFPGDGFRSVLIGKTIPRMTAVMVLVALGTIALARLTGGWTMLPVSLVLIVQSGLVATTAGIFVSLRSPIPLPDRVGSLAGNNAGCLASLIRVVTLFAINIATTAWAAPTLAFALLGRPLIALIPGVALLAASVWWYLWIVEVEGRRTANRVPELLASLSLRS